MLIITVLMQELKLDLQGAKAATEKAAASGHKHQAAVAQLTGDNLVLVLRAKAAEDDVTALKKEREELRAAIDEQRGPWFDEVRLPLQLTQHRLTCKCKGRRCTAGSLQTLPEL